MKHQFTVEHRTNGNRWLVCQHRRLPPELDSLIYQIQRQGLGKQVNFRTIMLRDQASLEWLLLQYAS